MRGKARDKEEDKQKIQEYFDNSDGDVFYDDIMSDLDIDLETVVEICNELIDEGKICLA